MLNLFSKPIDTLIDCKKSILKLQDDVVDQSDEKHIRIMMKKYGEIQLLLLKARSVSNEFILQQMVNVLLEDNFLSRSMPNFNLFTSDGQRKLLQIVRSVYESESVHKISSTLYHENMDNITEMLVILIFSHISDDIFDSLFALVFVFIKQERYLKIFLNNYNNIMYMDQRFTLSYDEPLYDLVLLRMNAIYSILFFDPKHSISILLETMSNRKQILESYFSPNVYSCGSQYLHYRLEWIEKFFYNEDYSIFFQDLLTDLNYLKGFLSLLLHDDTKYYSMFLKIFQLFVFFPTQTQEVRSYLAKHKLVLSLLLSNHQNLSEPSAQIQDRILLALQKFIF